MLNIPSTWKSVHDLFIEIQTEKVIEQANTLLNNPYWQRIYSLKTYRGATPTLSGVYTTSRNLTRNIGKCIYDKWGNYALLLSPHLLQMDEKSITHTIVHEVAHAYTPYQGHSRSWYNFANTLAQRFNIPEITTKTNAKQGEFYANIVAHCCVQPRETIKPTPKKYGVKCPCCGATWWYSTKCAIVKNPSRWQCRKCKQKLINI